MSEKVGLRLHLAWALYQVERKDEAKKLIDEALEINPQSKNARLAKEDLFPK